MKRPSRTKVNKGPVHPRNRKERAEKAEKFIQDCEQSLIRLIDQRSREEGVTWTALELELRERFALLRHTYPDHKGKIAIAVSNVEKALRLVVSDIKAS